MPRSPSIVVGGGASGVLTALALLRHTTRPVVIIHPGPRLGPGVAHGTTRPEHRLNSPAKAMGADADDPGGFVAWGGLAADDFAPRQDYGDYLTATIRAAHADHPGRLFWARDEVTAVTKRLRVTTRRGDTYRAGLVVLAVGNPPPGVPAAVSAAAQAHPAWHGDPWAPAPGIDPAARVLLLGTGLTAIDTVLGLRADGQRGEIVAVSRHGLLPRIHPPTPAVARTDWAPTGGSLRAVLRDVIAAAGRDEWRTVVDRTRPQVNAIWAQWSVAERERFLRHVWRFWEVHRHRMADPVARALADLDRAGLGPHVRAGRVTRVEPAADGLAVTIGADPAQPFDAVVNCTGPGQPRGIPLVADLLGHGLARPDPLGLGVEVDPEGRLVRRDGRATEGLYVVGPLRKGLWFETTAIPEIRAQATALATAA